MKIIVMLLCSIFLFEHLEAQNYVEYHLSKYEAEKYILQQDYTSAIDVYLKLQADYPHCFHSELNNLSLCYLKKGMVKEAIDVAKQLVLHGYTSDNLLQLKEFKNISESDLWNSFKNDYPNLRHKYSSEVDSTFIALIDSLIVTDQANIKISDDVRDLTYYRQGKELLQYIQQNGFPNFYINKEVKISTRLSAMLRHFFYFGTGFTGADSAKYTAEPFNMVFDKNDLLLINSAIVDGKLPPNLYPFIFDEFAKYGQIAICIDYEEEKAYIKQYDNYTDINKNRKEIGLSPIDSTLFSEEAWYKFIPVASMKQAMIDCDSCQSYADYFAVTRPFCEETREKYRNHELDGFILSFNPTDIRNTDQKGSTKYMKNIKKNVNRKL